MGVSEGSRGVRGCPRGVGNGRPDVFSSECGLCTWHSALPGRRSEIQTLTTPDLENQNVPLDKILSRLIDTRVDNSGRCLLLESNHGSEGEHGVQAPSQIRCG